MVFFRTDQPSYNAIENSTVLSLYNTKVRPRFKIGQNLTDPVNIQLKIRDPMSVFPVFGRLLSWCINGYFTMFYLYTGAEWGGWG